MDDLQEVKRQVKISLFLVVIVENAIVIASFWEINNFIGSYSLTGIIFSFVLSIVLAALITIGFTNYALAPLKSLWQLILHLSPSQQGIAAPVTAELKLGQKLVADLSAQVYQMVDIAARSKDDLEKQLKDLHNNFIAQSLPLPLIVIDAEQNIKFANDAAAKYIGIESADMLNKNVYMVLDMSFPSNDTFDNWLKRVTKESATASSSWERVRLNVRDSHPARLFDLAAYYNRGNADNNEAMLIMFDHTKMYSQDEQAISFMALSVHELRTPLTLLRGYIEVFEDELGPSLNPEQSSFMQKMLTQAEVLTDYVNNILNVARIDDDQMELKLQSGDWANILKTAVESISLRAKVRGIALRCRFATDLPAVAVDRLSIQEVINNIIDNAIKYSGDSKVINISTFLNKEGLIETTVEDFGNGIPAGVIPNLFTKFYRDYHNRAQVGGTGLGLYLSKAIVSAHGGIIWVRSQVGKGSTFGFTLQPYAKLSETLKDDNSSSVTRVAHGWIKNHSLYRR